MFQFIKNIFVKRKIKQEPPKPLIDENGNVIHESAINYIGQNRLLKIPNDATAIILYKDNRVELVTEKIVDKDQHLSDNEETLMAIAVLMKDPNFCEILRMEFHKMAVNNINKMLHKEDEKE